MTERYRSGNDVKGIELMGLAMIEYGVRKRDYFLAWELW